MTIAATRTLEFDLDTIIAGALKLAGLMTPGESTADPNFAAKRTLALFYLETVCKQVQSVAVIDRHSVRATAAVTALSATVTLSTSTMTMLGDAMFVATGETVETPVTVIGLAQYHGIPNKDETGRPVLAYFDRQPTPTLTLWPVPNTNGTIAVISHILAADVSNASNTLDFERTWTAFFLWELAGYMDTSAGGSGDKYFARAATFKDEAVRYSRSTVPGQLKVNHRTPWTGQ